MDFRDFIDLNLNEVRNFVVQVLSADPANTEARLYYNSTSHALKVYDGTSWQTIAVGTAYTRENAEDDIAAAFAAGSQAVITVAYTDNGSSAGSFSMSIAAGAVTLAMMANIADATILGNNTGGAHAPVALTASQVKALLAIVAADISDFNTAVRTNRLDQMAAPTADVSMNSHKITNVTDPTGAQDAATKAYVDALVNGLDWKPSVRAATTANGTLATAYANGQAIDGVTLATGDRILLKNQTSGSENGIYVVAASGAPTRAIDADANAEVTAGMIVMVEEGTVNADTMWVLTNNGAIVVGTTALVFAELPTPGELTVVAPLVRTGNQLSLDITSTTHAARVWSGATAGGATSEVITHNLNTRDVVVQVFSQSTPWQQMMFTIEATSVNTITIRSGANITAGLRVVVMG